MCTLRVSIFQSKYYHDPTSRGDFSGMGGGMILINTSKWPFDFPPPYKHKIRGLRPKGRILATMVASYSSSSVSVLEKILERVHSNPSTQDKMEEASAFDQRWWHRTRFWRQSTARRVATRTHHRSSTQFWRASSNCQSFHRWERKTASSLQTLLTGAKCLIFVLDLLSLQFVIVRLNFLI